MSNDDVARQLVEVLRNSGLSHENQVKAISMARVAIQPRVSQTDWRAKAKPIERPSGGIMPKPKRQSADTKEKSK